jgi:CCR4-NOT transcription complex subunit 1
MKSSEFLTQSLPTPRNRLSYTGVDALSKLIVLLVKVSDGMSGKVTLFRKLLNIFGRALLRDADSCGAGAEIGVLPSSALTDQGAASSSRFDQRPYLRLLTNLLRDLQLSLPVAAPGADETVVSQVNAAAADATTFNTAILGAFAGVFYALRPERVPGFAFSWLELVSHRLFLPPLLNVSKQAGWPHAHLLLLCLLRFLHPQMVHASLGPSKQRIGLSEGAKLLYKGTLRVFLMLLHDFPDFLADYALSFVDAVPMASLQLRNVILSASPSSLKLPEPLAVASLTNIPECGVAPRLLTPIVGQPGLIGLHLAKEIETFLATYSRTPPSVISQDLLSVIYKSILSTQEELDFTLQKYSFSCLTSFVVFVISTSLINLPQLSLDNVKLPQGVQQQSIPRGTVVNPTNIQAYCKPGTPVFELLKALLNGMDLEGKYLLFASIVNQLRYPNSHSTFASFLLISFFEDGVGNEVENEKIRETILRALVERIITHRPHPWALVVTCKQIMKNSLHLLQMNEQEPVVKLLHEVQKSLIK